MISSEPLVSILALCYNQEKFCIETLESISNQTYSNIELIIMDDCSSDNSVVVIDEWIKSQKNLNIRFIKHSENKGICATLNEALSYSSGKYIELIACDDLMHVDKTLKQVSYLEKSDDTVGMVYTDAYLINEDSSDRYGWFIQKHRNFEKLPSGYIYDVLLEQNFIPGMSVMIKHNVLKKIGHFDEKLSYEDYDMWLRIAKTHEIICMPKYPSVHYRLHKNNFHKKINDWDINYLYIFHKHLSNPIGLKRFTLILNKIALNNRKLASSFIKKNNHEIIDRQLILYIKTGIPFRILRYLIKR